jgi:hypothetical protein
MSGPSKPEHGPDRLASLPPARYCATEKNDLHQTVTSTAAQLFAQTEIIAVCRTVAPLCASRIRH